MYKKASVFLSGIAVGIVVVASILINCSFASKEPNLVIKGIVKDSVSGEPIHGATVSDADYGVGSQASNRGVSDQNGYYSYSTWYEEHKIVAEIAGYNKQTKTLFTKIIRREKEKIINFDLAPVN